MRPGTGDWELQLVLDTALPVYVGVDSKTRHLDLLDLSYFTILNYC